MTIKPSKMKPLIGVNIFYESSALTVVTLVVEVDRREGEIDEMTQRVPVIILSWPAPGSPGCQSRLVTTGSGWSIPDRVLHSHWSRNVETLLLLVGS